MKNIVRKWGPFWERNDENFDKLREEAKGLSGVYLLYCGWFPVYVGRCQDLSSRIAQHRGSKSKAWDRFTWFALTEEGHCKELEAIFLRSLPFYLRLNNKQGAHLGVRSVKSKNKNPEQIRLPRMFPKKRAKKT